MKVKVKLPWLFEAEWGDADIHNSEKKIAWELYCELGTRIGVVDFDPKEDIIINCIISWFSFFNFARDSLKKLKPPKKSFINKLNRKIGKNSETLSSIILKLLNDQIRPFLRFWYPIFEHFWEKESDLKLNPIERQKKYPNYEKIIADIKKLQNKLKDTSEALLTISVSG